MISFFSCGVGILLLFFFLSHISSLSLKFSFCFPNYSCVLCLVHFSLSNALTTLLFLSFSCLLSVSFSFCSNQALNSFFYLFLNSDQIILSDLFFIFVERIIGFLFILWIIEVFCLPRRSRWPLRTSLTSPLTPWDPTDWLHGTLYAPPLTPLESLDVPLDHLGLTKRPP